MGLCVPLAAAVLDDHPGAADARRLQAAASRLRNPTAPQLPLKKSEDRRRLGGSLCVGVGQEKRRAIRVSRPSRETTTRGRLSPASCASSPDKIPRGPPLYFVATNGCLPFEAPGLGVAGVSLPLSGDHGKHLIRSNDRRGSGVVKLGMPGRKPLPSAPLCDWVARRPWLWGFRNLPGQFRARLFGDHLPNDVQSVTSTS